MSLNPEPFFGGGPDSRLAHLRFFGALRDAEDSALSGASEEHWGLRVWGLEFRV